MTNEKLIGDIQPERELAPERASAVAPGVAWTTAGSVLPIVIIGAGGIVRDAHLPAYSKAGFSVAAMVDQRVEQARTLVQKTSPGCFVTNSIAAAVRHTGKDVVFDVAVPAAHTLSVLEQLPDGAAVLMQKPMGNTLAEARAIVTLCERKGLVAAVNFQLRWAPVMVVAQQRREAGLLGTLHDMEVQVSVHMPWEMWGFLKDAPRLEILYHSIHYVDLMRAWLGEPASVYAKSVRSPVTPALAATKTVMVMDYGEWTRAFIATNHSHVFGAEKQRSFAQWEGTDGAMRATMGVNLNYPIGEPDKLEYVSPGQPWQAAEVGGNWFPDAFAGSMRSLQEFVNGSARTLPTRVSDALRTMALVEAAYESSRSGGTPVVVEEAEN